MGKRSSSIVCDSKNVTYFPINNKNYIILEVKDILILTGRKSLSLKVIT